MNESKLQGLKNILIEGTKQGSIVWDKGTRLITEVYLFGTPLLDNMEWIDGKGLEAYPASIDSHVHDRFDEPEKESKEHLEAGCIQGGVGTIITMPNNRIPFTHPDQLEARIERWRRSPITVRFNIGVSRENLSVIAGLHSVKDTLLGHVKEYDASTTNPSLLIDDEPTQYKAAEAIGQSGRIKLVHAEYEPWLKRNRASIERERLLQLDDHCVIRSSEVEVEGIRRALVVCRDTRVPTHFCHVSTPRGLQLITHAKKEGLPVTCETCPHYWRLNLGHLRTLHGRAKMNPALRSEPEMRLMEKYVCSGLVDIVSTDHAPHTPKEKAEEEYDKIPSGVPGVETLTLSVYDLKARGLISAYQFVDLTSRNAARIFGFNKGELFAGKDADIILINPDRATRWSDSSVRSKCGWTPFAGETMSASIAAVVLGGRVVKDDGLA